LHRVWEGRQGRTRPYGTCLEDPEP
jgi:hypothetical protein